MHHVIMMLCIISCIYGTHAASSSSHCLTSLYFFFFFFVIITYSLPYHDSYHRSDVTSLPLLGRGSPGISYLMGTRLSTMSPKFSQFLMAMRSISERFPMKLIRVANPIHLVLSATTCPSVGSNPIYFPLRLIINYFWRRRWLIVARPMIPLQ
jgi:hypothetical protein